MSADGRFVAFASDATNIVSGDTNGVSDVFLFDRLEATTIRVSVATGGAQGDDASWAPALSADGRFVAFKSHATTLVSDDTNGDSDIFLRDRMTGTTTRVSVATGGLEGNGSVYDAFDPALSADGRFIAFESYAGLVDSDTNPTLDVYVHDRQTNTTTRVSAPLGEEVYPWGDSIAPGISADGRFVTFNSSRADLVAGDTNDASDVFVHDRLTGATARASVGAASLQANGGSIQSAISADGRFVAFISYATNLVAGDTNGYVDVFVHDRVTGATTRVNVGPAGAQADYFSYSPALSADGRYVVFESYAENLVAGDTNGRRDFFLHDRATGTTTRVSVSADGAQANGEVDEYDTVACGLSASGRFVAFQSAATNLVPGDTNGVSDVFLRDRGRLGPALANDFDGDGTSDVAVFRPGNGTWYAILTETGEGASRPWGQAGDVPVPCDYDADGLADMAVYRPSNSTWYIVRSTTLVAVGIRWGQAGDVPAPADFDGDGRCDPTVFRPSNGTWYQLRSTTGGFGVRWGVASDKPIPADFDGDGRGDPAVFRPSTGTWFLLRSTAGPYSVRWGVASDIPLAGDYDADGRADPTIYRLSEGAWYERRSLSGSGFRVVWGTAADLPVVGDYDGDGRMDPTVFRPGVGRWYQLRTLTGSGFGVSWGQTGDIPK